MWLEPTPNGKYKACERYTDPYTGKQRKTSITIDKDTKSARKAAQEVLNERIAKLSVAIDNKDTTLRELADAFIARQKKATRPQTWKRDEIMANQTTDLLGPQVKCSNLSAGFIRQKLDSAGKENITKNTYLEHIKRMLKWGYVNDYVSDISFLQKLTMYPDNKKERIEDKFLSADELRQLLEGMKRKKWRLLTQFLALSGLRIGEAFALLDTDVQDVIYVNKTMDLQSGEITGSAKTDAGNREVFVQPELEETIKKIRQYVRISKMKTGNRSALFFPNLEYGAYNNYLKKYSREIINHQITPHALRHTHVSLLAENGVPLDVISRRVGHEDSKITRHIYLHITEKQKEKDKQQLAGVRIM